MSWQSDIENKVFTIITGDSRTYTPKWKSPIKEVEYNIATFDFINVTGSLVNRGKPKARRFDLEFYFDGDDCIDVGNRFEISARDTRRWTLKHPFYGDIICQPLSLKQDNTALNCSMFRVPVMETLIEGWPKADEVVSDVVVSLQEKMNGIQIGLLPAEKIDKASLKATVNAVSVTNEKWIRADSDLANFKKAVADALNTIDEVVFDAELAVRNVQAVINFPATVQQTVEDRINVLIESLNGIIDSFDGTFINKFQVEALGGTCITAINRSASTNITDDYLKKTQVFEIQDLILNAFNSYLLFLDGLQNDRADTFEAYEPDFDNMNGLDEMVNTSLANLYQIAFTAKQERSFVVDADSNPVLLAHRFYGLDPDDINLQRFIDENEIGLNEMLNIRKGRTVIYYA